MTIDWSKAMGQRFRYYEVDRGTWRDVRELAGVTSCSVTRDAATSLIETANLTAVDERLPAECVVRAYIECDQGAGWERLCVGTWVCQTPKRSWSRGVGQLEVRAYSMLLGPSDDKPGPLKTVRAGADAAKQACSALSCGFAPVLPPSMSAMLTEPYTCRNGASMLDLARAMAEAAGATVLVDAYGRPYLAAERDPDSLSPSWTYEDGADSILIGGIDDERDWFALPNVAEVVVSTDERTFVGTAVNADPANALSVPSRGRRVVLREPGDGLPVKSQAAADRQAAKLLAANSSVERKLTYVHGFCPVRVGDCVRVLSRRHGVDVRARVSKQVMRLETGCTVTEEATCTMKGGAV